MRIVAGFLLLTALLPGQQSSPISVCELLRDSDKYGGKIVTIRAYIHGGARHGYYLAENADEKQCSEMPNSKREWPPTVALRWLTPGAVPGSDAFEREEKVFAAFYDAIREIGNQRRTPLATITGQIRTRRDIKIFHELKENIYVGNGYGQFGMHPVQLIIQAVLDIRGE